MRATTFHIWREDSGSERITTGRSGIDFDHCRFLIDSLVYIDYYVTSTTAGCDSGDHSEVEHGTPANSNCAMRRPPNTRSRQWRSEWLDRPHLFVKKFSAKALLYLWSNPLRYDRPLL